MEMIDQTPGCGNENVWPGAQRCLLSLYIQAACEVKPPAMDHELWSTARTEAPNSPPLGEGCLSVGNLEILRRDLLPFLPSRRGSSLEPCSPSSFNRRIPKMLVSPACINVKCSPDS